MTPNSCAAPYANGSTPATVALPLSSNPSASNTAPPPTPTSCSTCAASPNPYYLPDLRPFNGTQEPIRQYLDALPQARAMTDDIAAFLERRLPEIQAESRSYLTVAVGCTGGCHRSVYTVERLAEHFHPRLRVLVRHLRLAAPLSDGL